MMFPKQTKLIGILAVAPMFVGLLGNAFAGQSKSSSVPAPAVKSESEVLKALHDRMDWRLDVEAYKSAKPVPLPRPNPLGPMSSIDFAIDTSFLKEKLSAFSGATSIQIEGQEKRISERGSAKGRKLALDFLTQEYTNLGFSVSHQSYNNNRGTNFIAEKAGRDPSKVLVISSHIDSVHNAGANDDGSGTIAALAVAKALSQYQFRYTLRVVGFDQEELGLVGSRNYLKLLDSKAREQIIGNIQMDMVSTNGKGDGAFHIIDCDRSDSSFLSNKVAQAVSNLGLPLQRVAACTNRSDHASFWNYGIPAIAVTENFFGGDEDPCYHSQCDVVDARIKFDFQANIAKAVASAASEVLEIQ